MYSDIWGRICKKFMYHPPDTLYFLSVYTLYQSICYKAFMETGVDYYLSIIKEEFSRKQRANSNFSLRAYAKLIGVHPSTLSQVLKGNRPLPLKNSSNVVKNLKLGPKEKTLFLESLYRKKTSLDKIDISSTDERFMLDESFHKVIAEWEHFAVLELFELNNFKVTVHDASKKLKITENRAEVVVNNLLTSGLLELNDNKELLRTHNKVRTTEDVKSIAIQESHIETLTMGIKKIEEIEVDLRDFSATTVAIDLNKLTEAKTIIREFRQKMEELLRDGNKTDLYQLAIQFFPITDSKNELN